MANISNSTSNTIIMGKNEANLIVNSGYYVTIDGGNGRDTIDNNGNYVEIYGSYDNDSIVNSGSFATIDGEHGNDFIKNDSPGAIIEGSSDDDTIENSSTATLNGGNGNDSIKNSGNYVSISGGNNNDYIFNDVANNVTIDGGNANDTIISDSGNNVSIDVGHDDDLVSLGGFGSGVTVLGSTDNDTLITDNYYGAIYQYVGGHDLIKNWNENGKVSLHADTHYTTETVDGNFVLALEGDNALTLEGAAGKTVNIVGGILSVVGGTAKNINNTVSNTVITGSAYDDTIANYSSASSVTINALAGNDSITNYGSNVTINALGGSDTIVNEGNNVSISGGADKDSISNRGSSATIDGGAGNDNIYSGLFNSNVTLLGGADNDSINNYANIGSINGGTGDDSIFNSGSNITIGGDTGKDTIHNIGDRVTINGDDNDDIIENDQATASIVGGEGNDSIKMIRGDNSTIDGGTGNDTISVELLNNQVAGSNISVNGGAGLDSINGTFNNSTVSGGADADTIAGSYYRSKINGDAGDDFINITDFWGNTINGGDGTDTISVAGGSEHSINGGAGNDRISLGSSFGTAHGGVGNDTIYGSTTTSYLYGYSYGDGNDTITNWSSDDTLTITGGNYSYSLNGDNGIVTVANSGTIVLLGAKGKTVNINGQIQSENENVVTQQEVIKKFMGVLDTTRAAGVEALNEAVYVATGGYFTEIGTSETSAIEQMIKDVESYSNGNDFLLEKCGIILGNDDTGAITGSDAGGSVTKTDTSVVSKEGALENFMDNEFTVNGLTVKLSNFPKWTSSSKNLYATAINYNELQSDYKQYIWQAGKTWWLQSTLNLIAESYGDNYSFYPSSSAKSRTLHFGFVERPSSNGTTMSMRTGPTSGDYGDMSKGVSMAINEVVWASLKVGDPNGANPKYGGILLSQTIAHEATHLIMMSVIDHYGDLPQFISEGTAELVIGIDNTSTNSIVNLANAQNVNFLKNSLALNDHGTGTIAVGTDYTDAYAGGYMFLRYLAKQGSENYGKTNPLATKGSEKVVSYENLLTAEDTTTINGALLTLSEEFPYNVLCLSDYASSINKVDATAVSKGLEIVGNTNANSIATGNGNDTVFANTGKDTLSGGNGNDFLCGEAGNDSLNGGEGDDTLKGGTGDDTLTGGKGNDLFVHVADTDLITDYAAGQDKIKLTEGKIVGLSISNSNLVMDVGAYGSITVKDGVDKKITVIDANDTETVIIGKTYDDTAATKVTLASGVVIGDATARTKAIKLVGNALDNTILSGSGKDSLYGNTGNDYLFGNAGNDKVFGQAGDDTLHGGEGNDTLTGGAGADVFIYTAGNDVIADYAAGEKISVNAAITASSVKGSDATFTIGSNTLKVTNGKGQEIIFIDADGIARTIIGGAFVATNSTAAKVTLGSGVEVGDATARTAAIKMVGNALDNSLLGGSGKDSLYGNTGDDYLIGNAGNDKLFGQAGDDTLLGGEGNDTLTGGAGNDLFIYTAGNDVIADYAAGEKILVNAAITASSVKGSDATFTIGSNTLKVTNGKGQEIIFVDADGNERTIIGGAFVATNSTAAKVTLSSGVEVGDATARTSGTKMVGNALDNSIFGGSGKDSLYGNTGDDYLVGNAGADKLFGQAGDDTLWGGIGNDTLTGGAGADTFIYNNGDGNDVIADFSDDDLLQITGTFTGTYNASANAIAFKVGSTASALTLKNFTATTFNINGNAWRIKNGAFVKK